MLGLMVAVVGAVIAALIFRVRIHRRGIKNEEYTFSEIFSQKCGLEQKMAGVVGGKTGMAVLLDMIQGAVSDEGQKDFYRENYRRKQVLLGQYMHEYEELLKKGSSLPEKERSRLAPVGEWEGYKALLGQKI